MSGNVHWTVSELLLSQETHGGSKTEDDMQSLPHRYEVAAGATITGDVTLEGDGLPALKSASPAEFGGPGDRWSPETLVVAAVADCSGPPFGRLLISPSWRGRRLGVKPWARWIRIDRVTRFTEVTVRASLQVPDGTNEVKARRLLEKAEQSCLFSNSLKATVHLEAEVQRCERRRE